MSAKKAAKAKKVEAVSEKPAKPQAVALPTGKVLVLLLVALGLVAVFIGSFLYRMDNPSLVVKAEPVKPHGSEKGMPGETPPGQMPQGMGGGAMGEIAALMAKLKQTPEDLDLLLEVAEKFIMVEAYDKASGFLDKAEKLSPDNPEILNAQGIVSFGQDKFDEAKAKFERAISLAPLDFRAQFNLGLLYKSGFKDMEKANKYFQMVLDSKLADPDSKDQAKAQMAR